jgi:hypothetical protein
MEVESLPESLVQLRAARRNTEKTAAVAVVAVTT